MRDLLGNAFPLTCSHEGEGGHRHIATKYQYHLTEAKKGCWVGMNLHTCHVEIQSKGAADPPPPPPSGAKAGSNHLNK
jgi:hypothetical protein